MISEENLPISKSTGVTIGLLVVIVTAAISASWSFGQWKGKDAAWKEKTDQALHAIRDTTDRAIESLNARVLDVERKAMLNRWTSIDTLRYTQRLGKANPALVVPEPLVR